MRRHRRIRNGKEYKAGKGEPLKETLIQLGIMGGSFWGLYTGNFWVMGLFLGLGLINYIKNQ